MFYDVIMNKVEEELYEVYIDNPQYEGSHGIYTTFEYANEYANELKKELVDNGHMVIIRITSDLDTPMTKQEQHDHMVEHM